jgi:hypothetical protein
MQIIKKKTHIVIIINIIFAHALGIEYIFKFERKSSHFEYDSDRVVFKRT